MAVLEYDANRGTAEGGAVELICSESKEETIGVLESLQAVCNAKADMSIGKGKILWAGYGKATGDAIAMLKEQEERIKTLESLRRIEHEGR